jgi:hypothetical protein
MRRGTLSRIFFILVFFAGFSLFIIIFASRNRKGTMGGAGGEQRPVFRVREPKKGGGDFR